MVLLQHYSTLKMILDQSFWSLPYVQMTRLVCVFLTSMRQAGAIAQYLLCVTQVFEHSKMQDAHLSICQIRTWVGRCPALAIERDSCTNAGA